MFPAYERSLQPGLVGAGPIVPLAGLVGSRTDQPFGKCVLPRGTRSMDLFVVPTISFRLLYGLLIMGHGRRHILWFGDPDPSFSV
jgi:hypothetical protein